VRILFITQWFSPEPHFKGLPFAVELKRRGHEVTVLTGFPNYPGGKVYPGYSVRWFQRDVMEGIPVLRVPLYPSHDRSTLGRVLNYTSFALAAAFLGVPRAPEVDVAYVYHPPATIGWPALVLKWLRGVPCVYDIQDLWPDTLAATGMLRNPLLLGFVGVWSRLVYALMDRVVVLSPGFQLALEARGIPSGRVSLIYNWSPDVTATSNGAATAPHVAEAEVMDGKFNVLFAGNMGPAQALSTVIDAAEILADKLPSVQFVLVGAGVSVAELTAEVARRRLRNVLFVARQPAAAMPAFYRRADVLLVHLKADPLFAITIPSKTQTYLAAGRPVVMAVPGDAADLVQAAEAGVCCPSENPGALAAAIVELHGLSAARRDQLGRNGLEYHRRNLAFPGQVTNFESVFEATAARARALVV